MAGEKSKKSGEIGEALTEALLSRIGWKNKMHNLDITCTTPSHINDEGNRRKSHGDDKLFLYNNPFHDDRTDFVHVSVKNNIDAYPSEAVLRTKLKAYFKALNETIECAEYDQKLHEVGTTFQARKVLYYSGLLVWLHNDVDDIEKNIIKSISASRLEVETNVQFYVIDNARASFLLKVTDDLLRRSIGGEYEFYYPRIGTTIKVDEKRTGNFLPLELISADIIPAIVRKGDAQELVIYANEAFQIETYKNLIAYGLNFAAGLVTKIHVGTSNFSPANDAESASQARMAFNDRTEEITPFSYNRTILDLITCIS